MRAATICLMLLCAAHGTASAAGSGKGSGPPSVAAQMQAARSGGGGGYGRMLEDPRKAPPLDPNRKIAVQDCSKPVDHAAGNLKCK